MKKLIEKCFFELFDAKILIQSIFSIFFIFFIFLTSGAQPFFGFLPKLEAIEFYETLRAPPLRLTVSGNKIFNKFERMSHLQFLNFPP